MMEHPVAWLVEEGGKRVPLCRCQQGIDPNKAEMLMLLNEMDRESKVDLAGGGRTMAFVEALRQLRAILSVDPRDAEIERLRAEVAANKYVPGTWCCPKCKFVLVQSNLNANTGTITARDEPGTKCPNCDTPLWRTTWRDEAIEMGKRCEEQVLRAIEAESALAALRKRVEEAPTCDIRSDDIGAMIDARPPRDWIGKRVALVVLGEG